MIWCKTTLAWDKVIDAPFNIDTGITHIYFLDNDSYIAELIIEDCENFAVLNLSQQMERSIVEIMPLLNENIQDCNCWKEQIDYLLNNEKWKPLGK